MARKGDKQLDRDDRIKLEALFRAGLDKKVIAEQMSVHLSTIYREWDRGKYEHLNSDYTREWRYSAEKAEAVHQLNMTAKGAPLKIGSNFAVAEFIERMIIEEHYSPAAVCALLREDKYLSEYGVTFCRATIYKYIDDGNIFPNVTNRDLPERGERKREYKQVREKKTPHGRSIEERDPEIDKREEPGHWEMDTVVGKKKTKARLLVL
ncbi:MAG: IS30 family transposase, partial [Lachnospiraceae bacterium]|nr:IS30 family transposase [Lachnospiraceae bacterium]